MFSFPKNQEYINRSFERFGIIIAEREPHKALRECARFLYWIYSKIHSIVSTQCYGFFLVRTQCTHI